MDIQTPVDTARIRQLNDAFRRSFFGGVIVLTNSVDALDDHVKTYLLNQVRLFEEFDEDNDPHAEHDFLSVEVDGQKYFGKIDYYDRTMEMGSPDPSNTFLTKRVITIMEASEY